MLRQIPMLQVIQLTIMYKDSGPLYNLTMPEALWDLNLGMGDGTAVVMFGMFYVPFPH